MTRRWRTRAALCALALTAIAPAASAHADERTELLGGGWQQSGDRMVTTSGDATGLHLLVADVRTGYTWRTAATLDVPGVEADQWIGNVCVTGSGKRAVAVYAPRTFTNNQQLANRGGFTAVVDLDSGAVTRLAVRTSLAYFNPGCGKGETAALTQEGDEDLGKTGVLVVDAANGHVSPRTELSAQVTSATPVDDGFVVADAAGLIQVRANGTKDRLVRGTSGVPFNVAVDADGGVVFMDHDKDMMRVRRAVPGKDAVTLATGRDVGVQRGAGGRVFLTGKADRTESLPKSVSKIDVPSSSVVSTTGEAAVTEVNPKADADPRATRPVQIRGKSLRTGRALSYDLTPKAAQPAAAQSLQAASTDSVPSEDPLDANRVCAVPRNDFHVEVMQPKPRQVEWAANMAVRDHLHNTRPANWHSNGLSSYTPQGMFQLPPLNGAPNAHVPIQILLGILGQESNLWQADRYTLPGEYGNPLIGNYYGLNVADPSDWNINWDKADCGYGISQMTDGMRLPGHPKPHTPDNPKPHDQQVAIATDYAANLAAGLKLLIEKWNQMQAKGMTLNNNDPLRLENWFYAVWAYNSGYHEQGEDGSNGAYGLGWLNNPINPRYPAGRAPFGKDPHDFAHPQGWPYPEKVLGFAANPPSGYEAPGQSVPFFRAASWNGTTDSETTPGSATYNRAHAWPTHELFCVAAEQCYTGGQFPPNAPDVKGEPVGPCGHTDSAGLYDLKCWVHHPATWKPDCNATCGLEYERFPYPAYADEQADGTSYPPMCTNSGIDNTMLVIDDRPDNEAPIRTPSCKVNIRGNSGSFGLTFGKDDSGRSTGQIDLHQISGGFGGHFWFGHNAVNSDAGRKLQITGTWEFNNVVDGLGQVMVHLPAHLDARTTQVAFANYTVYTSNGPVKKKLDQLAAYDRWVVLGEFPFYGKPKVSLTNLMDGPEAPTDVVWDAVAIRPLGGHDSAAPFMPQIGSVAVYHTCMQPVQNSSAGRMELRPCSLWTANTWIVKKVGSVGTTPTYSIQDRATGLCLEPENGSTDDNVPMHLATCNAEFNNLQQWFGFVDHSPGNPDGQTPAAIRNLRSQRCLEPQRDGEGDGIHRLVKQTTCWADDGSWPDWTFEMS
ncbi:MAG: hypothetical protein ABIQ18_36680 [Umezawaea sp.]